MKYRKKSVEVDAIQFEVDSLMDLINFVTENSNIKILEKLDAKTQKPTGLPVVIIETSEGSMVADLGDWVIKGADGGFYFCKPDIFEKNYEELRGRMNETYVFKNLAKSVCKHQGLKDYDLILSVIMNYFDETTTAHGTLEIFTAMEKELEKYYLAKEKEDEKTID